mgnify:CR=1 FL=1
MPYANDIFKIVTTMMAGTIWDSCTIQQQLVQELLEFYSSFLLSPSTLHTKDLDDSSSSLSSLTPHMPFWSVNYTTLLLTPDPTTTIIIIIIIVVSWDGSPISVMRPVVHGIFPLPRATKRKKNLFLWCMRASSVRIRSRQSYQVAVLVAPLKT